MEAIKDSSPQLDSRQSVERMAALLTFENPVELLDSARGQKYLLSTTADGNIALSWSHRYIPEDVRNGYTTYDDVIELDRNSGAVLKAKSEVLWHRHENDKESTRNLTAEGVNNALEVINRLISERGSSNPLAITELTPLPFTPDLKAKADITISFDRGVVSNIEILTERLRISPVTRADITDYHLHLFSDAEVMRTYGTGEVKSLNDVTERVENWVKRWESGDPFVGFAIRTKSRDFVGHVVLGHGDEPGRSELAYLVRRDLWGNDFGKEAVKGIVQGMAPLLRAYGLKLEGEDFSIIDATVRTDNTASRKILSEVGIRGFEISEKYGAKRYHMSKSVPLPDPRSSWEITPSGSTVIVKEKA